jgi:DNA-directed RNA polymerase specialized sigma24 family protein
MGEISEGVYGKLLHRAERILPPDPALEAADLVQSAFAKACRWLDAGRPELEQLKYLYAVLNSVALDHRRRLKRRVATVGGAGPDPGRRAHRSDAGDAAAVGLRVGTGGNRRAGGDHAAGGQVAAMALPPRAGGVIDVREWLGSMLLRWGLKIVSDRHAWIFYKLQRMYWYETPEGRALRRQLGDEEE